MKFILLMITMLLTQSSWGNKHMEIECLFESELKKRNISFSKVEDGIYDVETSEGSKNISIHKYGTKLS
jgi:hypothetical protein